MKPVPVLQKGPGFGLAALVLVLGLAPMGFADVIPPERRVNWNAGVPGGIPNRTTIFATFTPTATSAQIQAALDGCLSNQVVLLRGGTYHLTDALRITTSGVTLRGNGPATTILRFTDQNGKWGCVDFSVRSFPDPPASFRLRNWVGGYARGSTEVLLSSSLVGDLAVGGILVLDQLAGGIVNPVGQEGLCGSCSRSLGTRPQQQYVRVTAINANRVTITPGLYMSNWDASREPQAWWWGSDEQVSMSGIEDVTIDCTSADCIHNVAFGPAYACWLKNVKSVMAGQAHVRTYGGKNFEIRECYFNQNKSYASANYGVSIGYCSDTLVENNIFDTVANAVNVWGGASGCVIGYNYATNMQYEGNWLPESLMTHGGHPCMNLFEGNFIPSFYFDNIHGSASHNTIFRNRLPGWEQGKSGNTYPLSVEENNVQLNVVGNILGQSGYHTRYESLNSSASTADFIYSLNPGSAQTLLRHGNFDVVTTANDGVRWDPDIADHNLPASLYLKTRPVWFGDRPWPAVDPLTPSAASLTNLPAGYRYNFGLDSMGSSAKPSPPQNLRVLGE